MNDCNATITELETLSREMLAQARAGEWEEVSEREERRRGLIDKLFAEPLPPELAPRLEAAIREVLASDQALIALGREGMRELAGKLGGLAQGRKAQRAYGAHR